MQEVMLRVGVALPPSPHPNAIAPNWDRFVSGAPAATYNNAIQAIKALGIKARLDTFGSVIVVSNIDGYSHLDPDRCGQLTDDVLIALRKKIYDTFCFDPKADYLFAGIQACAESDRFNPVADYLESLTWDGTSRLESWLPHVSSAEKSELNCAIGKILILGLVARARFPGTKFDYCIMLEGPQGCGKSSLVRMLAMGPGGDLYTDAPGLIAMPNKERGELIANKWVVELAEMTGLNRSGIEGVKAFLSQTTDRYRSAYAKVAQDHPRTCIFIGTTNASGYLMDATGNRRFLPVAVGDVKLKDFVQMRDQLFAEADLVIKNHLASAGCHAILGKPLPYTVANDLLVLSRELRTEAAEAVEERRGIDALEEAVRVALKMNEENMKKLDDGTPYITAGDLLRDTRIIMGPNYGGAGLGTWMSRCGWTARNVRLAGHKCRIYVRS